MKLVRHANDDLEHVLLQKSRHLGSAQKQVQALLHKSRFLSWLRSHGSDLILVNGNIQSASLNKISALSTFSADLITSLTNLSPNNILIYYFCGLHSSFSDGLYGPEGIIRSLIVQIVTRLETLGVLTLGFLDNWDKLKRLEKCDLKMLFFTFHSLLLQLTAKDTIVYCIIDSISWFDKQRTYGELRAVLEFLADIATDTSLMSPVKVILTSQGRIPRRVAQLECLQGDRIVNLSPNFGAPLPLSQKAVEGHIIRSVTPSPMTPRVNQQPTRTGGKSCLREDSYYSDDSQSGGRMTILDSPPTYIDKHSEISSDI